MFHALLPTNLDLQTFQHLMQHASEESGSLPKAESGDGEEFDEYVGADVVWAAVDAIVEGVKEAAG